MTSPRCWPGPASSWLPSTLPGLRAARAGRRLPRRRWTAALAAYRNRLAELAEDLAAAELDNDIGRARRARDEREWIVAELRRSTRPGRAARTLGVTTAERARKAVSARIRDAIHRIAEVMPDLGAHLERSVRTGNTCRYDP